jgi:hypothetical protein
MYDIDNKWVIGRSWHWTTPQKEFIVILYNDEVNAAYGNTTISSSQL